MIRRFSSLCALLPLTFVLGACTTDSDESVEPVTTPVVGTGFVATFKPDLALMPFPSDVWRSGSTDGTLNIYAGNPAFESDPLYAQVQQMNMLDGFGLNSAVMADFSGPLNAESLVLGQTVFVFNVTDPAAPAPVATFELGTADFQGGRSVLELNPTAPLAPLNTYAVILTNNIQSAGGTAASADAAFQAMVDAFPAESADTGSETADAIYAQMVHSLLGLAEGAGIGADNVISAWTFTTQSVGQSLAIVEASAQAQDNAFAPLLRDPADPAAGIRTAGELLMPASDQDNDGVPDTGMNAQVYAGVIEMPYYLDPANPLTSFWQPVEASCQTAIDAGLIAEPSASTTAFCPQPETQATLSVPVLLTVPDLAYDGNADGTADCPGIGGVTVFQHGITQNRTNLLPLAGTLAQGCQAGIAIDLPLHGIVDTTSPLYASTASALNATLEALSEGITEQITEQTFDLDVDGNDEIDPSGEYFINLESPLTARDALRQAAANLAHLVASLGTVDYDLALASQGVPGTDVGADFTGLPVSFVGHSLGGITGTVFLGVNADVGPGVLAMPGGNVTDLILNSNQIYPEVEAGLAENGLTAGMRFFDEFFRNAQTLIEGGDPINYAAAANAKHNILMFEVVGGAGSAPDQVVPNVATGMLADAMGLPVVTTTTIDPAGVDGLVQFTAGDHGSILSPAASLEATTEMQTQTVLFIAGNPAASIPGDGAAIVISNPAVIAQ